MLAAHRPMLGFWAIPVDDTMVIRERIACVAEIPIFYLRALNAVVPDRSCHGGRAPGRTPSGDLCSYYVGVSVDWRGDDLFHWDPDSGWTYLATTDGDHFVRREQCFGTTLLFRFEHTADALLNTAERRYQEYDGPIY